MSDQWPTKADYDDLNNSVVSVDDDKMRVFHALLPPPPLQQTIDMAVIRLAMRLARLDRSKQ